MRIHRGVAAAPCIIFLLLACGGNDNGPADTGGVAKQAGDGQSATVGTALQPYQVRVTDANGAPVAGVPVSWSVVSGGGSVAPGSSSTDASGLASATATLDTLAGVQTVGAAATGYAGSPRFSSTGLAGPPARIEKAAGNLQQAGTSEQLPLPLSVKVSDRYGNAVAGRTVSWSFSNGSGQLSAPNSVTGADGLATILLTLPGTAGSVTVTAAVAGVALAATFDATAVWKARLVAQVPIPDNYALHDTYVRDGIAFAFAWNTGLIIFDVGNGIRGGSPANPVEISRITVGGQTHNGWWFHNPVSAQNRYLFIGQEGPGSVGSSSSGDIHVVDVSNLASPTPVATFHLAGAGPHNFWMDEAAQVLYAAYYNGGVVALDVSGTLAGTLDTQNRLLANIKPGGTGNTYVWGVQLVGNSLYAVDMLSGFWKLSAPGLAVQAGGNNVPERYGSDLWVANGYGYTGTWFNRAAAGNAVKIWDLASGAPVLTDSLIVSGVGTISDLEVSQNGKLLALSAERGGQSGVYFYSLANPVRPVLLARSVETNGVHTLSLGYINGRVYAFGAKDPAGSAMMVYDVTDMAR
jgi:hypothetical protein